MKKLKPPTFISKKYQKLIHGKCQLCENNNQCELDVHRILEGKNGGKYSYDNTVILCSSHHRQQQSGQIKIIGWVNSTKGRLLHWIDENNKENFS